VVLHEYVCHHAFTESDTATHIAVSRRELTCTHGGSKAPTEHDRSDFGSTKRLARTGDNTNCIERYVVHTSIAEDGTVLFRCRLPMVCNGSEFPRHTTHSARSTKIETLFSAALDANRSPFMAEAAYQSILTQVASGKIAPAQAAAYASLQHGPVTPSQGAFLHVASRCQCAVLH
jgi:hypothetical protein